jgi:hypothetical protein
MNLPLRTYVIREYFSLLVVIAIGLGARPLVEIQFEEFSACLFSTYGMGDGWIEIQVERLSPIWNFFVA